MMFCHILPMHSPQKMFLSSTAPHKPSLGCGLLRDVLQPYQVYRGGYGTQSDYSPTPYIGHTSPILCASFSPTGNLLATGSGDCNARLWDLFTETPSHVLTGHKGWVLCVEWEPMERKLATGGHDGHVSFSGLQSFSQFSILSVPAQVRLWDPKTGKPNGDALRGHSKWVTSLAWEPAHMYVLVCPCSIVTDPSLVNFAEILLRLDWHRHQRMAPSGDGLFSHAVVIIRSVVTPLA